MRIRVSSVGLLLFASGAAALIFQIAWIRQFRLVFGASTAASAAVLAIFMGGLGLGSALFGKRADSHPAPLLLYARLVLLLTVAAAISPFLILGVRWAYIEMGGILALGTIGSTIVRLLLSALVLSLPTVLMGGTLPAAVKAVECEDDPQRSYLAWLYGLNTLGGVVGAMAATFFLLATFGTRNTLWLACAINLLVAILARNMAGQSTAALPEPAALEQSPGNAATESPTSQASTPFSLFIYASAAIAGFSFFLMEIVWFRMLGPILGGSTYTFGLILAIALLGIGLGGACYACLAAKMTVRTSTFALTCAIEALCLIIPYALGDRIALLGILLQPVTSFGFASRVFIWFVLTCIVILPAAIVSGFQFPLLIALLGRGNQDVGHQTGYAYAWNTLGAIAGSLASGFGLLTLFTAPGLWRGGVYLLAALSLVAALYALAACRERVIPLIAVLTSVAALGLTTALGPSAAWRHSPVGAGRVGANLSNANELRAWVHRRRRMLQWESEGTETSVALMAGESLTFFVNGKSDGSARGDASTQVMLGMVSAFLHPKPERSLVIGLGTGSSAGWLADIATMERVDVVELEPAIAEVARRCTDVNRACMKNPKVRMIYADAREILLTSREKYDLIVSEPSNPYRAGIASLYTQEFYSAVAQRLGPGAVFSQWVQAYEIDAQTVRSIYATLHSVFPHIQTWQTNAVDLLLLCSKEPIVLDVPRLESRLREEPYRSAVLSSWRATDLEGFLARFVANADFGRTLATAGRPLLNTDDRTLIEFGFARTLGQQDLFSIENLREMARRSGRSRPDFVGESVNWSSVEEQRAHLSLPLKKEVPDYPHTPPERRLRNQARLHFLNGEWPHKALRVWAEQGEKATHLTDVSMIAECLAFTGNDATPRAAELLRIHRPIEADVILAWFHYQKRQYSVSLDLLVKALTAYRHNPWPSVPLMERSLDLALALAEKNQQHARQLLPVLQKPFSVHLLSDKRLHIALSIATLIDLAQATEALTAFEPYVPWEREFLKQRYDCYRFMQHPLAAQAEQDLLQYLRASPLPLQDQMPAVQD